MGKVDREKNFFFFEVSKLSLPISVLLIPGFKEG